MVKISKNKLFILAIGLVMAILLAILQISHFKWLVISNSFELYAFFVAILFTGIGIAVASVFINKKSKIIEKIIEVESPLIINKIPFDKPAFLAKTGVTEREYEVLVAIVQGYSNQEIADKLFVSLSTVKTHISNIYDKLDVIRRSQLIQKVREHGLN